jgi:hypothetical protein
MSTVHQRLRTYRLETLPLSHRREIGKRVRDAFFAQKKPKFYKRHHQKEGGKIIKVLFYENEFDPIIDNLISDYCSTVLRIKRPPPRKDMSPIQKKEESNKLDVFPRGTSVKRERRRIPAKKPAYSVRLNK